MCNLSELKAGQRARVTQLRITNSLDQRLLSFGLMPGTEIRVSNVAPLGDPIAINFQNQCLSLRRFEAVSVGVSILHDDLPDLSSPSSVSAV